MGNAGSTLKADNIYLAELVAIEDTVVIELIDKLQKIPDVAAIKMLSFHQHKFDIHILHKDSTKENSIKWLQQYLGIPQSDTIGIGDGYNDFHIFNAVGRKIAVNNAVPELKKLADEVIGDVSNDPVAEYLLSL